MPSNARLLRSCERFQPTPSRTQHSQKTLSIRNDCDKFKCRTINRLSTGTYQYIPGHRVNIPGHRIIRGKKTVSHNLYRPGQTISFPRLCGFQISWESVHGGGKFVSLTQRPTSSSRKCSWYPFPLEIESIQSHSAAGRVVSKTSLRIEPAIFRFLARCLKQLHHHVLLWNQRTVTNFL